MRQATCDFPQSQVGSACRLSPVARPKPPIPPPVRLRCGTVAHPKAPRHWKAFALPESSPLPEGSSPLDHQWLSHGSCARSLAVRALVRAPKEEQWIANGQSHRTNGALAKWPEKANREALPLSPGARAAGKITVRNGEHHNFSTFPSRKSGHGSACRLSLVACPKPPIPRR